MIKKSIIAAFALAAVAAPVCAQTEQAGTMEETIEYSDDKYKVETNHFWDNWFVTVGAGGGLFLGDHDRQIGLGKRISPALDIEVGKWFTPGLGLRLGYNGLSAKGATRWSEAHSTGEQVPGWNGGMDYSKFKYFNLHADVLFNFSNLFCGYNENRIWNSSPYVSVGWMRTWEAPTVGNITMSVGWLNTFRLNKALDLNLDLRGALVDDAMDGEMGGSKFDGMITATVGLTYKFKQRGWSRSKTVTRTNMGEINALRDQLNRANEENARLRNAIDESNREPKQAVKKTVASNLIIFRIGSAKLSKEARANLGLLAEAIKSSDPNAVYTITGYADAGTGSKKTNERLSKERAEAVRDCLVNEYGVSDSRLRIDYKGGVSNMFYDDPRLSRAVITRGE
jgi:outer membrane protein OmpA-like peptidoglycan-associated protein